jgi:hypothetical protein
MALRLHAAADEGDRGSLRVRESLCRHRAQACSAHGGDPIAVDHRERQAGVAILQHDQRVDGGKPALGIARIQEQGLSPP